MTVLERKMLVEICRAELARRPSEHDAYPPHYEPPGWLLAALAAAYDAGRAWLLAEMIRLARGGS